MAGVCGDAFGRRHDKELYMESDAFSYLSHDGLLQSNHTGQSSMGYHVLDPGQRRHSSPKSPYRTHVNSGMQGIMSCPSTASRKPEEHVIIAVKIAFERFKFSSEKELEFPIYLSSTDRVFIHRMAQFYGFSSKSSGKGSKRFVTIKKNEGSQSAQTKMTFKLSQNSRPVIRNLLLRFPVTNKERTDLLARTECTLSVTPGTENSRDRYRTSCRLNNGIPQVPQRRGQSELEDFRLSLPICGQKDEIIQLIKEKRVVLVVGETGSGKTTQIPQYLLDDSSQSGSPVRMFCAQPRRLAAIAVAERVAAERGESVGQTIGYQVQLESRISPKTLLTFCTIEMLLRTLMAGDSTLSTVTHVIVDDAHERAGFTDILLTKIRDMLQKMPMLKLVISSAALDVDLFRRYFGSCSVINIIGRTFEVKQLFLEDILRMTGYANTNMMNYNKSMQRRDKQPQSITESYKALENSSYQELQQSKTSGFRLVQDDEVDRALNKLNVSDLACLEQWQLKEMDACIFNIFHNQDTDAIIQMFNLILNENISVNYMHSETCATPLMVTAGRGFLNPIVKLLNIGASVNIKSSNGWTALDWAKHFEQTEAVKLLESYSPLLEVCDLDKFESTDLKVENQDMQTHQYEQYHINIDEDRVDLELIMHLLLNICSTSDSGAILIFLPGYDEIVELRDRILHDNKKMTDCPQRYQVFILHANMQTLDHKRLMMSTPSGVRKVILSTSIAESSISIDDVVFVIDSGKVKEKSFDFLNQTAVLKMAWISKSNVIQRRGRAGRCKPGICFHLFTRLRFNNMMEFKVPQLLQMPLQELCLYTKLLGPVNCTIAEFLSKAPTPPSTYMVHSAVKMLKKIDAMDPWEELTELGYQLADLPVEPHLGKMVLCAVVLKCLDPVLTIASMLAYNDPFILPTHASLRAAMLSRKHFSAATFSDHVALLRAFQAWQKACIDGWERTFCEKNFLSQATMEIIISMRKQLLGQLRANGFVRPHGGVDIRDVNLNSENWAVVKAALVAGMYPKLIHVDRETNSLSTDNDTRVLFHPTSAINQHHFKNPQSGGQMATIQTLPTDWLIYDEMDKANRVATVRCCSVVTPTTVAIFGGCSKLPSSCLQEPAIQNYIINDSDSEMEDSSTAQMKIDEWLNFQLDAETAGLIFQLRQKWQTLFLRRIRSPSKPWTQQDEVTLHALVSVLRAEEQASGLQQPTGIGQRPRPMSTEEPPEVTSGKTINSKKTSLFNDTTKHPTAQNVIPNKDNSGSISLQTKPHSKDKSTSDYKYSLEDNSSYKSLDYAGSNSPTSTSGKFSNSVSIWPTYAPVHYFIMKSNNLRNIEISQTKGIWSTTPSNEVKLNKAFIDSSMVFLIFSVQGSGHFQGFARMTSVTSEEHCQDWGSIDLGGVFTVEWINKESLPFQYAQHLLNPWNDNKKVQISRDGQELEPQAGKQLLLLWERISGKAQEWFHFLP